MLDTLDASNNVPPSFSHEIDLIGEVLVFSVSVRNDLLSYKRKMLTMTVCL